MNTKQLVEQIARQIIGQFKEYFGFDELTNKARVYVALQAESVKASIIDGSSKAIYGVVLGVVLIFLGFFIFLFLNLMLGFGLSEWFFEGKYWTGFGILTAFYLLLLIVFLLIKSSIKRKIESGVDTAVKDSPLALKSIPEILYNENNKSSKESAKNIVGKREVITSKESGANLKSTSEVSSKK